MKQPLKRRIGLRYSNEFYFVTPAGLVNLSEIPVECGLVEIGIFTDEERNLTWRALGCSFILIRTTTLTVVLQYQPFGERRRGRRGNLLQVCCGTSKRCSRVDLRSSQINSVCPL